MSGFYGQYLNTIGLEMEGPGFEKDSLYAMLRENLPFLFTPKTLLNIVRDASVESTANYVRVGGRALWLNAHTELARYLVNPRLGSRVMGYEMFTVPMEVSQLEKIVFPLTMALIQAGDFTSERAATHFHIGFANNLRLLKNLLRVVLMIDPLLFRLGGMGGTFRGYSNLAGYARPIINTSCARIIEPRRLRISETDSPFRNARIERDEDSDDVDRDEDERENDEEEFEDFRRRMDERNSEYLTGEFAQVINPTAALEASNIEQFWASFGLWYDGRNLTKYNPSRYTASNFYAVAAHQTMEFRHFNQTLNPFLIMAIGKFLRATVEMSTMLDKQEVLQFDPINPNEEISISDCAQLMEMLNRKWVDKEIEDLPDDREMELIFETLENSHFEPLPKTPVFTHSRENAIFRELVELGNLKVFNKILKPTNVDIHNIQIQSIFDRR